MSSFIYDYAKKGILDGSIDLLGDTLKVMLVKASYTPNQADQFLDVAGTNDLSDDEIVATDYAGTFGGAGRKTLASKAVNVDTTNHRATFDAADLLWAGLGGATNDTPVAAVIIKEVTTDADSIPIAYIDTADLTTNDNDFGITWHADGIFGW